MSEDVKVVKLLLNNDLLPLLQHKPTRPVVSDDIVVFWQVLISIQLSLSPAALTTGLYLNDEELLLFIKLLI
jgi:hypothetical protein